MSETDYKGSLMIVDDVPENLRILQEMLSSSGYRILMFPSGKMALNAIARHKPDLLLLDIMMPEMDGFAMLRSLREMEGCGDLPVIFISALGETHSKVRAFRMGGVDYITKPFQHEEVLARVETHLSLRRMRAELQEHNHRLEELVREKVQELEVAYDRLRAIDRAKNDYLSAISHEIRTPVNGLLGIADLALSELPDEELKESLLPCYETTRERIMDAIDGSMKLLELQEKGLIVETTPIDLPPLVEKARSSLAGFYSEKRLSLAVAGPGPARVLGNRDLILQSVLTLLRASGLMAHPGSTIDMRYRSEGERVAMEMDFPALALSEGLQRTFFDVFSPERTSSLVESLGFSVPLSAALLQAMGCGIRIGNTGTGIVIGVSFPRAEPGSRETEPGSV